MSSVHMTIRAGRRRKSFSNVAFALLVFPVIFFGIGFTDLFLRVRASTRC